MDRIKRKHLPKLNAGPLGSKCRPECRSPTNSHAHCTVCHNTFSGVTYFDDHRLNGECINPAALGLVKLDGLWASEAGHVQRQELKERLAEARIRNAG